MSKIILGLGSNINNPLIQLQNAVDYLKQHFFILKVSSIYISQSLLKDEQPDYYNIILLCSSDKTPLEILQITKDIENQMGRIKIKEWGERVIDIDIIDYDNNIYDYDNLNIPHKQMIYRSFVLKPLMEIMPDYIHPQTKQTVMEMYDSLDDDFNIKILEGTSINI